MNASWPKNYQPLIKLSYAWIGEGSEIGTYAGIPTPWSLEEKN